MAIGLGVRYSNGRKDSGFRFLIQLVPSRIDDAIEKLEKILENLKEYKKEVNTNPEKYDLKRVKF